MAALRIGHGAARPALRRTISFLVPEAFCLLCLLRPLLDASDGTGVGASVADWTGGSARTSAEDARWMHSRIAGRMVEKGSYAAPQLLQSVDFETLTGTFLKEFSPYNITPTNITLERGDGLFGYSIKAHLFNHLVNFTSTAVNLEASFTRLIRATDRAIVADCLHKLINIAREYLCDICVFDLGLHAAFDSQKTRDAYLTRANPAGLAFVGTLGYKTLANPEQMIRFQIDQSCVFPEAAYITWTTIGMKVAQLLEPDSIWTPFFAMLEPVGLKLSDE